jgi:tetratricopeptide (TPR) repeat protein
MTGGELSVPRPSSFRSNRVGVSGEVNMLHSRYALLTAILALCGEANAAVQSAPAGESVSAAAATAYDAKDWEKAAKLYGELSKPPDAPPRVWLRLGASLRELRRYDESLAAFEKASAAGGGVFGEYGEAAVYTALKQTDKAFEHLEKAVQQGYAQPDVMSSDANLATLKNDPRFTKLLEQARKNQRPCAYSVENRQFDFWLGEWAVTTTSGGIPAGDSKIDLILEDCVVQENWKSLNSPYSGKSYNIYNASMKRWEQYWVDNIGGNIFFYGGMKDGVMDYWTDEIPQPSGPALKRHLQFIPMGADKVRQFSRGSTDGGRTWNVEYDFTYTRKHSQSSGTN